MGGEAVAVAVTVGVDAEAERGRRRRGAAVRTHLRRVRHISERLVGARHSKHLRGAGPEDVEQRDLEARTAQAQHAQRADGRVDPALAHERQERVLEVLTTVRLLVHVLLQHGEVGEGEEDTRAGEG